MNYCIRCKYYIFGGECEAIKGKNNIVTGKAFTHSKKAFNVRYIEAYCGADGRWFKKLEEEKQ